MNIAALYMAAGSGKRMGFAKQEAKLDRVTTLGGAALGELLHCGLRSVNLVARPDDLLEWLPAASLRGESTLSVIRSKDAHIGIGASLACGLQEVLKTQPDAVLVVLADQPMVSRRWLSDLMKLYQSHVQADYVCSGWAGALMPPAVLSAAMCRAVLPRLQGDRGAGAFFSTGEFEGRVMSEAGGWSGRDILMDVDLPEELEAARARWNSGRSEVL